MKVSPHDVAMLSVTEYVALTIAWSKNKKWFDDSDIDIAKDKISDIESRTGIELSVDFGKRQ